jgi:hypothetical protein
VPGIITSESHPSRRRVPPGLGQRSLEIVAGKQFGFTVLSGTAGNATNDTLDDLDGRVGVMDQRKLPLATIRSLDRMTEVRGENGEPLRAGYRRRTFDVIRDSDSVGHFHNFGGHLLGGRNDLGRTVGSSSNRFLNAIRHGRDNRHSGLYLPNPDRGIQPQLGDATAVDPIGDFLEKALLGF